MADPIDDRSTEMAERYRQRAHDFEGHADRIRQLFSAIDTDTDTEKTSG